MMKMLYNPHSVISKMFCRKMNIHLLNVFDTWSYSIYIYANCVICGSQLYKEKGRKWEKTNDWGELGIDE